eukprot:409270-Pleurochrysis_carterae.AAC.1
MVVLPVLSQHHLRLSSKAATPSPRRCCRRVRVSIDLSNIVVLASDSCAFSPPTRARSRLRLVRVFASDSCAFSPPSTPSEPPPPSKRTASDLVLEAVGGTHHKYRRWFHYEVTEVYGARAQLCLHYHLTFPHTNATGAPLSSASGAMLFFFAPAAAACGNIAFKETKAESARRRDK